MKKHCFILWTRPEIIKLYSCIKYCIENELNYFIIHTNQHYSLNMDSLFFEELGIPKAKYNLWIHGWSHGYMCWRMLEKIEEILLVEKPDIVYLQGDTNSVLAWALAWAKIPCKIAHIEAWLRSYDRSMPEEINRIVVDSISDYLFAPTKKQEDILLKEWVSKEKVFVVWNTIVDAVFSISKKAESSVRNILTKLSLESEGYILLTIHRPSNVDTAESLKDILLWINEISRISGLPVVLPLHPRTKKNVEAFWLEKLISKFRVIEPIGFQENIALESHAALIATDSWGMQEEGCILGRKTLILRDTTERPETLETGWAILVGNKKEDIVSGYIALANKEITWFNPFWDWTTAEKIFSITR